MGLLLYQLFLNFFLLVAIILLKKAHYFPLMTDIAKYWLVTAIIVQPGTLGDGDMSP